ncbi:bifunctional Helicase [Babesia duncani]|uniref:Bifunctional Helicase n=1 Tax=Babesia duncani TaxID=323732 RepID=A0AAD9PKY7_9APIC|nr:bifunctional Helicase [Babesia duncani]
MKDFLDYIKSQSVETNAASDQTNSNDPFDGFEFNDDVNSIPNVLISSSITSVSKRQRLEDPSPKNGTDSNSLINPSPKQDTKFDGKIALVLYSPQEFYVAYCKKQSERFSTWKSFLAPEIYDFIKALGIPFASKALGNQMCVCFEANQYQNVAFKLAKYVSDTRDLDLIPPFIHRTFGGFAPTTQPPLLKIETNVDMKAAAAAIGPVLYSQLKPFQLDGIKFGLERNGKILIGDEMGLGKTLQALGICACYTQDWPLLIVCPSSLRFQWRDQCARWLPHLVCENEICLIKNSKTTIPMSTKIIVTSYDMLVQNEHFRHKYMAIIVDESHYLKNKQAKRTKCLVPLIELAKRVILLSGTPTLNVPSELYTQISCIIPNFTSHAVFVKRYCEEKLNWFSKRLEYTGSKHTHELHQFLVSSIMIRRLKETVMNELPPKMRSKVPVELPKSFISQYKETMASFGHRDANNIDEEHFAGIQQVFKDTGVAKCEAISEYILHLLNSNTKFIVFAHHQLVLDSIQETLQTKGTNHIRIDGSTPLDKRNKNVQTFQENPKCMVAVLSITACGIGLNLTASSTVVFAELHWVPGLMIQAEDRAHRIGTVHKCINIYYLIAQESIEEVVWRVLNRKWASVTSTLDGQGHNLTLAKPPTQEEQLMENQTLISQFFTT